MSHGQKRGILADEQAQARLRAQERRQEQERENDLRRLMQDQVFRRFLVRLIDERCNVGGKSFNANGSLMSFHEGERSVGVDLRVEAMRLAPEEWVLAEQEEIARRRAAVEVRRTIAVQSQEENTDA